MTAVRRVWSPQDVRDAAVAAAAVNALAMSPLRRIAVYRTDDEAYEARRRLAAEGLPFSRVYSEREIEPTPMPVSKVRGRTRGRHRAHRLSPIRVWDLGVSL